MRILSPSKAPPVKGLVGSIAITPTLYPCETNSFTNEFVSVDFPAPGGPVIPILYARPVLG